MIAAALVGAIGLGGGMAYTYKIFFASRTGPVAYQGHAGADKAKPEVADGKGFPHTDKKLLNRLGDEGAPAAPAPPPAAPEDASDDPNAPRRVQAHPDHARRSAADAPAGAPCRAPQVASSCPA